MFPDAQTLALPANGWVLSDEGFVNVTSGVSPSAFRRLCDHDTGTRRVDNLRIVVRWTNEPGRVKVLQGGESHFVCAPRCLSARTSNRRIEPDPHVAIRVLLYRKAGQPGHRERLTHTCMIDVLFDVEADHAVTA
jgi:hypothetical protein